MISLNGTSRSIFRRTPLLIVVAFLATTAHTRALPDETHTPELEQICRDLLDPVRRQSALQTMQRRARTLLEAYLHADPKPPANARAAFVRHGVALGEANARRLARHVWWTEDNPSVRDAAAQLAAHVQEAGILHELLTSEKAQERLLAVRGLRGLRGSEQALTEALRHDDRPAVRAAAAKALALSRHPSAASALLRSAALDTDPKVRREAARALRRCLVHVEPKTLENAVLDLVRRNRLPDELAPVLPDLLSSIKWHWLVELCDHERASVRAAALTAIGARYHRLARAHQESARDKILAALAVDRAPIEQRRAIRIAARLRLRGAVPVLIERLRQRNAPYAHETVEALERISGEQRGSSYSRWKRWLEESQTEPRATGA